MANDNTNVAPTRRRTVSRARSITKALSYRLVIVALDFLTVYLFTRTVRVALGFMIVSNLYTTLMYIAHERIWANIQWGISIQ
jgi:adenylylsulfate kinase